MTAKLSIVVSDEMMNRIDDYRFGNRIDKKQTAVIEILEAGLNAIEGKAQTRGEDTQSSENTTA